MTQRIFFALAMATLSIGVTAAQTPENLSSAPLVERPRLQPSMETVVLSFPEDVSLKEVFHEISEQADVTMLFDESFRDQTTLVNLGRVSVEDALAKLTTIHRLFYKILDSTTVIIIPDNAQKHRQYDDMLLHTFYVEHNDVNAVANMFRTLAGIQRVQPDPVQKSVTVRATADQLLVAQSVLERNDAPPTEVTLQVEILAVDGNPEQMAGAALTAEAFARFKDERDAELLVSQTIRLTDNQRGSISIEEGGPWPVTAQAAGEEVATSRGRATSSFPFREEEPSEAPVPQRAVGLQLSFHPQVFRAGRVQLSLTLQATAPAADDTSPEDRPHLGRSRGVTTTVSMNPGEVTLLPAMFRVNDFGVALHDAREEEDSREVVVAIGAAILQSGETPNVLPPLPMGTEQRIQVPRP